VRAGASTKFFRNGVEVWGELGTRAPEELREETDKIAITKIAARAATFIQRAMKIGGFSQFLLN
jgi:hypothetical protein